MIAATLITAMIFPSRRRSGDLPNVTTCVLYRVSGCCPLAQLLPVSAF